MTGYLILLPFALLLLGVFWALFAEKLPGGDRGAAIFGGLLALASAALFLSSQLGSPLFGWRFFLSAEARFAATALCLLTGLWLLWMSGRVNMRMREAVALGLLSLMGGCVMVGAYDLVTLVLGIELATMPAYVLIGYNVKRAKGLEGAVKYFLLSVLSSLVMIYGISFLFGITGSLNFSALNISHAGLLGLVAVLLVYVGIFAKLSAAPFHYWAPDAYEGAESWIVSFVASVPKIAGIVVAVRLTAMIVGSSQSAQVSNNITFIIGLASAASMILGSFAALTQKDIRRIMAYSGVVNAGYMLMPLVAIGNMSVPTITLFATFYAIATMGVLLITDTEGGRVADLAGMSKRRPVASAGLAILALSLVGVPPMVGFFGKFYVFTATVANGQTWLVIIATICSVVSAFYYLRLVKGAYFDVAPEDIAVPEAVAEELPSEVAVAQAQEDRSDQTPGAQSPAEPEPRSTSLSSFVLVLLVTMAVALGPLSGVLLNVMANPSW